MRGRLIVLDGVDGCGKSTQLKHLSTWLPQSGLMPDGASLHLTKEPGGTSLGYALRSLLLDPSAEFEPEPLAELLLYAADRAQHVAQLILPALQKGDWILCDRFSGSTYAYQGYGRELDLQLIEQLENIATMGIVPDLTFWLDIDLQESISRRKEVLNDRIEDEGSDFLERVIAGFSELARKYNWVKVNANQEMKYVTHDIEVLLVNNRKFLQESCF